MILIREGCVPWEPQSKLYCVVHRISVRNWMAYIQFNEVPSAANAWTAVCRITAVLRQCRSEKHARRCAKQYIQNAKFEQQLIAAGALHEST